MPCFKGTRELQQPSRNDKTQGMQLWLCPDLLLGVEATIHVVRVSPSPGAKLCQFWVRFDLYAPSLQCHCSLKLCCLQMSAQCLPEQGVR